MKIAFLMTAFISLSSWGATTLKWNYKNTDLMKIVEAYSTATGTQFVIDSTVRGKVTLLNPNPVTPEEAFNQLSRALALNGFSWIKKDNKYIIRNARSAQRDNLEIYNEAPPTEPEHMASLIYSCKANMKCDTLTQQLRMLTSSYGEMAPLREKNALIISDFTGNLNRIYATLEKLAAMPDSKFPVTPIKETETK